jgi:hypothetical protein
MNILLLLLLLLLLLFKSFIKDFKKNDESISKTEGPINRMKAEH